MRHGLRYALTGTGRQLVACAERLLSRGHVVVGILSGCPIVAAWAGPRGLPLTPPANVETWLDGASFDYLLSIVNHAVLPARLLEAPTSGAINYHDSLLPAYAGFNATSWAILEGQATHGVTWHWMTTNVDGGDILLQQSIDIGEDDTGFTLGVKCSEAGVATFTTLLDQMERGVLVSRPQAAAPVFRYRFERPDLALLDFARPAAELHAMVRGLNLGPDDNWMARPKLVAGSHVLCVLESRLLPASDSPAGGILALSARGIDVAAGTGAVSLTELATLDGVTIEPLDAARLLGLAPGSMLPPLHADLRREARTFDAGVTRHERFWVRRLAGSVAPVIQGLTAHAGARDVAALPQALPPALAGCSHDDRVAALTAMLAAGVQRLGGGSAFDLVVPARVPALLKAFYAPAVPVRCQVETEGTFAALRARLRGELADVSRRGTYANDVFGRYGQLRGRSAPALTVGVHHLADAPSWLDPAGLPPGLHLALAVSTDGSCSWIYDRAAISDSAMRAFADRCSVLLGAALDAESMPIGDLPLLAPAERDLLLKGWQDTARAYDVACVHELIERQVARTPEATAVIFDRDAVTYRDLNDRANALARRLRAAGVGPDVLVGICIERSIDLMVGLLGILKAGGAYVPMDPAYPADRLSLMLEDSKAPVLVTQRHLVGDLPAAGATTVLVDEPGPMLPGSGNVESGVEPGHLAYVIFTSGSTGRPKGTMLEHRNVANFFAGMDAVIGTTPGTWLAATSISFDISVLELFWTLARGFKVVIAPETDRASIERRHRGAQRARSVGFGLFYFAADSGASSTGQLYRLLIEGARFADQHGFEAVWTPERHFHTFGGLYPNPAVTTAAIATVTSRIHLRAGSVVLPLHNPLRVAEDWAVIDQLSGGRIGLSFASGWHVNDFAFMPGNYERRREVMEESIATVRKLWRGETVPVTNGAGETIEVAVLPRPLQANPPLWIAAAGNPDTFVQAGRLGANILTNMLGQDLEDLRHKFAAYRRARREAGHEGEGVISVMLHTFVCEDDAHAKAVARKPFSDYLASSFDLVKVAPKMFPAFRQPSREADHGPEIDAATFTPDDMAALLDHAVDRYFDTAGLFGAPETALRLVDQLAEIGATEMACLIDFGIDPEVVLANLPHLERLRSLCQNRVPPVAVEATESVAGVGELIARHAVTHFQCTPSMARTLTDDPESRAALAGLERFLVGGEALPADLAGSLAGTVRGQVINMYGPTETTVWSTTSRVTGAAPTIGRPIANTVIRILDERRQLVPVGAVGELWIGGDGVARGYLGRPDLTAERFADDPFQPGHRLYRTGDLARYRQDGDIEFLGRQDHQVKISGHRIELGEIETLLMRHPSVRQAVVLARTQDRATPMLAAYVVRAGTGDGAGADADRVRHWQQLWDEAYRQGQDGDADPRFTIAGWNDSYSGAPIPSDQMREWVSATVQRIAALQPRRVLEIGCGTGLLLYRLLPLVEHYTGVDVSEQALAGIRRELSPAESAKVTLVQRAADALDAIPERSCDLLVINSVAQYFPDAGYLARVLTRAADLVADGGHVFVGDVRSLAHLEAFHAAIELEHAAPHVGRQDLRQRITRRASQEAELVLGPGFFHALVRDTPRLTGVRVDLKLGRASNEMNDFRYDVVLQVGAADRAVAAVEAVHPADSLDTIRMLLQQGPAELQVVDVPNARLSGVQAALRALSEEGASAAVVRAARSAAAGSGVHPDAVAALDPAYDVQVTWARSGDPSRFDATFRKRSTSSPAVPKAEPVSGDLRDHANRPYTAGDEPAFVGDLRAHLAQSLPDFMVPQAFVVLDALPLTPNGKIDRKALPDPTPRAATASAAYVPPGNELEQQIATIWQDLLALERVGRGDNIFDLGATSLLTMQANSRLSATLGRKVSLVSMFRYPTVAALAGHLGENGATASAEDSRAKARAARAEQAAERRRALRSERREA